MVRTPALRCESCGTRRAVWATVALPEEEGARFGDEVLGRALCLPCLEASEADGPWDAVYRIDERRAG